jgi:ATP-dependent RNA helicase DHR2
MPERVYTIFDDDSKSPEAVQAELTKPNRSKKRKRTEKNGTEEDIRPMSQPHGKSNAKDEVSATLAKRTERSKLETEPSTGGDPHTSRPPQGRDRRPYSEGKPRGKAPQKSLSERSKELFEMRKGLPIWQHKERIRGGLRGDKGVMLLVGETGSGKSTQVPQFLLSESWCRGCIAITQPRRVAAVSLARRVAEEMGTPLGSASPASKVGYSVRFDTSVSPNTKIKYLTEGMLLQEMLRDPSLRQYSAVIVDEVHERSVNVDLILGFLRNLINGDKKERKGKLLKVVVMSATADVDSLFNFFHSAKEQTSSDKENNSGDPEGSEGSEGSWAGISDDEKSSKSPKLSLETADGHTKMPEALEKLSTVSKSITICHIEGRQYPVQTSYLHEPTQDFVEAALKAIFQIHVKEPLPGDILVFLTGQDTVESLERLVNEYASTMDSKLPKVRIGANATRRRL